MRNLLTVAEAAEALNVRICTVQGRGSPSENFLGELWQSCPDSGCAIAQFIERNTIPARESGR